MGCVRGSSLNQIASGRASANVPIADDQLVMLCRVTLRHEASVLSLVVGFLLETDRKRVQGRSMCPSGERRYEAGINAAAAERAERDVAPQSQSHGILQQRGHSLEVLAFVGGM